MARLKSLLCIFFQAHPDMLRLLFFAVIILFYDTLRAPNLFFIFYRFVFFF